MAANGISTFEPASGRRDLKLALAQTKREAVGTQGYRPYNLYIPNGTVSPATGHPWLLGSSINALLLEDGGDLLQENAGLILLE